MKIKKIIDSIIYFLMDKYIASEAKNFAEWCLQNKAYNYDIYQKYWYSRKTLVRKSWEQMHKSYLKCKKNKKNEK